MRLWNQPLEFYRFAIRSRLVEATNRRFAALADFLNAYRTIGSYQSIVPARSVTNNIVSSWYAPAAVFLWRIQTTVGQMFIGIKGNTGKLIFDAVERVSHQTKCLIVRYHRAGFAETFQKLGDTLCWVSFLASSIYSSQGIICQLPASSLPAAPRDNTVRQDLAAPAVSTKCCHASSNGHGPRMRFSFLCQRYEALGFFHNSDFRSRNQGRKKAAHRFELRELA
jgi:hypothetical protein